MIFLAGLFLLFNSCTLLFQKKVRKENRENRAGKSQFEFLTELCYISLCQFELTQLAGTLV